MGRRTAASAPTRANGRAAERPAGSAPSKPSEPTPSTNASSDVSGDSKRTLLAQTPCRFWVESGGCRRGARCRFLHEDPSEARGPEAAPANAWSAGAPPAGPWGGPSAAAPPVPRKEPVSKSWAQAVKKGEPVAVPPPAPPSAPASDAVGPNKDQAAAEAAVWGAMAPGSAGAPPPVLPEHIGDAWTGPAPRRRHSSSYTGEENELGGGGGGGGGFPPAPEPALASAEHLQPATRERSMSGLSRRFSLGDPPASPGRGEDGEMGDTSTARAAAAAAAAIATYGPIGSPSSTNKYRQGLSLPSSAAPSEIGSDPGSSASASASASGIFLMPPPHLPLSSSSSVGDFGIWSGLPDPMLDFAAAAGGPLLPPFGVAAPPPGMAGMRSRTPQGNHSPPESTAGSDDQLLADDEDGLEYSDVSSLINLRRRASADDVQPSPALLNAHRRMNELAEAGAVTDLGLAFQQLVQTGLRPSCATFSILLKGCARAVPVRREQAVAYYISMPEYGVKPNAVVCTSLLHVLAKVATPGDVSLAQHVFQRMKAGQTTPNAYTYSCMISLMAKAGSTAAAEALYSEMLQHGLRPDPVVCTGLLSAFAQAGDTERARRLFDSMQRTLGLQPTDVTYNTLISAMSKAGRPDEAARLLAEMAAPSTVSFTAVMAGYASQGHVAAVGGLFQQLVQRGLAPTVFTFNAIVNAHAKAGDAAGAQQVLTAMRAWGVAPNVVTFNTVLHAMSAAGNCDVEGARRTWAAMADAGVAPDAVSFHSYLRVLVDAGELSAAEIIFAEAEAALEPDAAILNLMLGAFASQAKFAQAASLLRRLDSQLEAAVAAEALSAVAAALAGPETPAPRELLVAVAHAVLNRRLYATRGGSRCEHALADAVVALAGAELDDDAQAIFAKMRDAVPDGLAVPSRCYHAVIALHARRGESGPARFLFDELRAVGLQPDLVAYSSMINLYGSLGEQGDERKLLQEMLGSL